MSVSVKERKTGKYSVLHAQHINQHTGQCAPLSRKCLDVDFITSPARLSCLYLSLIPSPWTLFFPSQFLAFSSFLSFHHFLFLLLSVSLTVAAFLPSLDPQAIASWLLHVSVSTEKLGLPHRGQLHFCLHDCQWHLYLLFCFEVFRVLFWRRGKCQQGSMSRWITSAFTEQRCLLKEFRLNDRLPPRWSYFF